MAATASTTAYSYSRRSGRAGARDDDATLQSKLDAARSQRTAFYRRLAETGRALSIIVLVRPNFYSALRLATIQFSSFLLLVTRPAFYLLQSLI